MFWNRTERDILSHWQADLSLRVELGRTPFFYLGYSDSPLTGLLAVQMVSHFEHHNRASTIPRALMGGNSVLWLYASLYARPIPAASAQTTFQWLNGYPGAAVIFTGVDPGTHMASLAINPVSEPAVAHAAGTAGIHAPLGVPRTMRWLYAPITAPAADAPWSAVPFLWPPAQIVQEQVMIRGVMSGDAVPAAAELPEIRRPAQTIWLAWCTLLFVGVILVAALFA